MDAAEPATDAPGVAFSAATPTARRQRSVLLAVLGSCLVFFAWDAAQYDYPKITREQLATMGLENRADHLAPKTFAERKEDERTLLKRVEDLEASVDSLRFEMGRFHNGGGVAEVGQASVPGDAEASATRVEAPAAGVQSVEGSAQGAPLEAPAPAADGEGNPDETAKGDLAGVVEPDAADDGGGMVIKIGGRQ